MRVQPFHGAMVTDSVNSGDLVPLIGGQQAGDCLENTFDTPSGWAYAFRALSKHKEPAWELSGAAEPNPVCNDIR